MIRNFQSTEEVVAALTKEITEYLREKAESRETLSLCLAGGSTPAVLYASLAREDALPWEKLHLFWGDDRFVPPGDERSNYRMVKEKLLTARPLPAAQVHRIQGEAGSPEEAADLYEKELNDFFGGCPPVFDITLLGIGPDGHTASLFPGSPVLEEQKRLVSAAPAPPLNPPVPRVTLTYPLLNQSGKLYILTARKGKEEKLDEILNRREEEKQDLRKLYPVERIMTSPPPVWCIIEGS